MSLRDKTYKSLAYIAASEFSDIVRGARVVEGKLRILISDGQLLHLLIELTKVKVLKLKREEEERILSGNILNLLPG